MGDAPPLFGILTMPRASVATNVPLILITNAGSASHVGPNRLHVLLARTLTARGLPVLRFDLAGLGDSSGDPVREENDPYADTMFRDIDTVLRYAQRELGYSRVVFVGLCSGAYAAFQAASQFTNPALVESVLINPLTFYWTKGMSLAAPASKEFAAFHYYMGSALNPAKWWKFLSGQSKIGLLGVVRLFWNRWAWQRSTSSTPQSPGPCDHDSQVQHPLLEDVAGDLRRAIERGRHLGCFFSRSDPGYSILMFHASREVRKSQKRGDVDISVIEEADHTFSRRSARKAALQKITDYLCQRYLA